MPKLSNKNIYKHRYDDPVFKIGHRLDYYRHLRDLIEGHKAKAADLGFRNKLIREQQTNKQTIIIWNMIELGIQLKSQLHLV